VNKAGLLRFLSMQQVSLHISSVYLKNIITPDIFAYLEFLEFSFKARSSKSTAKNSEEQQQAAGFAEHPHHQVSGSRVSFFWTKKQQVAGLILISFREIANSEVFLRKQSASQYEYCLPCSRKT
jgi:hypothetical protein